MAQPSGALPGSGGPPRRFAWSAIPAVFLVIATVVAAGHSTFREFDGLMQWAAGRHLIESGIYDGWASHFWPPLYPALIGLLDPLVGGFWAAKLISLLSAAGLLAVVFGFATDVTGSRRAGFAAQALVAVNPLFVLNAIEAQNHMLDAFLFVAAVWLLIRGVRAPSPGRLAAAGAVAGAATMTRYQSGVLLAPAAIALIVLWFRNRRSLPVLAAVAAFFAGFGVAVAPWLLQNWIRSGSPLATWQHLNIGSAFLAPERSSIRWWWLRQSAFHSLQDVYRADPAGYWRNVRRNLGGSAGHLFTSAGVAAPLVAPGVAFARRVSGRDTKWIIVGTVTCFVLLISQAFTRDYLFLSSSTLLILLGAGWLATVHHRAEKSRRIRTVAGVLLLAPMVLGGAAISTMHTKAFLRDYNTTTTTDAAAVGRTLRADPSIATKRVMAIHPIYAYEAGSRFVMAPLYFPGKPAQFVRYEGVDTDVRRYAPRIPVTLSDADLGADYLVVNQGLVSAMPQFQGMLRPEGGIPPGFRIVFATRSTVVYRIGGD